MKEHKNIADALKILSLLELPTAQQNKRSAVCLLALLNLVPEKTWQQAENPLIGITPMMNFSHKFYKKNMRQIPVKLLDGRLCTNLLMQELFYITQII